MYTQRNLPFQYFWLLWILILFSCKSDETLTLNVDWIKKYIHGCRFTTFFIFDSWLFFYDDPKTFKVLSQFASFLQVINICVLRYGWPEIFCRPLLARWCRLQWVRQTSPWARTLQWRCPSSPLWWSVRRRWCRTERMSIVASRPANPATILTVHGQSPEEETYRRASGDVFA